MGKKFFESLKKGLEEAIAHDKGEITLRSKVLLSLPKYKTKDIREFEHASNVPQSRIKHSKVSVKPQ